MEPHKHFTLFRNIAHRQASTMTVTPKRSVNRRQDRFRLYLADVPKCVHQHALLDGHLCIRLHVLHGATAATAGFKSEMRTERLDTLRGLFFDADDSADFITRLIAETLVSDDLTGQGAFNKNGLTFAMRHTSAVLI